MPNPIQALWDAQTVFLRKSSRSSERENALHRLSTTVAPPVLAHFLRLIAQGSHGVALVQHGVCSECHIRVASSTVAALVQPEAVHVCEQCGRYLMLAPGETALPPRLPLAKKATRAQKVHEPVEA
jgi:predicted  nucleic acid-binding Zn-ribbon protein